MKSLKVLFAAVCCVFVLAGCNTMHGLGEDISSGGKALAGAAKGGSSKAGDQKAVKNSSSQKASTPSSS